MEGHVLDDGRSVDAMIAVAPSVADGVTAALAAHHVCMDRELVLVFRVRFRVSACEADGQHLPEGHRCSHRYNNKGGVEPHGGRSL
mgnify:CR=1 FL=1